MINALRFFHKGIRNISVVIAGAGSAGYGIFRILQEAGCKNIVVTDSFGAIYENRVNGIDSQYKKKLLTKLTL